MVLKQLALERVVRAADANEARCEMAVWRLQDADNQTKRLAADNTQLRCVEREHTGGECVGMEGNMLPKATSVMWPAVPPLRMSVSLETTLGQNLPARPLAPPPVQAAAARGEGHEPAAHGA